MTDTPAPFDFTPYMVMGHTVQSSPLVVRETSSSFPGLLYKETATPILTVSLEEAARRASNVWHARDAIKMWQAIVLEICALKVREARDVATPGPITTQDAAERAKVAYAAALHKDPKDRWSAVVAAVLESLPQTPRALPDRETLARTIFGIMTFGGTWFSSDGILEMRSLCAADRALELCAGAAPADIDSLRAQLILEEANSKAHRERADKAEAELAALKQAQPTVGQIVPAKPTLEELESAELKAQNRYLMFISRGRGDDRNVAMLVYLRSEWGRAAAAVDAAREVKS